MKIFLVLTFMLFTNQAADDKIHFKEYKIIQGSFTCISASSNGYTVAADKEGIVYLWDPEGNLRSKQSYRQYGQIDLIDASNPLDIFIYFRLNRKLLVLDNQLNAKKELDFNAFQNYQVRGLGRSADGNCWIIDARERMLRKIDFSGKSLQSQTVNFKMDSKGFSIIRDNGSSIVCGAEQDTVLNIYSSSLVPGPGMKKPPKSWSLYGGQLYVPLDAHQMCSYSMGSAKMDTVRCSGSYALDKVQVHAAGMVNLSLGSVIFYNSGNE